MHTSFCGRHACTVLALSVGAWTSVAAQGLRSSEPTPRLDDITITAQPWQDETALVPAQQLTGSALTQRQASTLGETLDKLPGVANSSFGPNVGRPVIRGMEGDRIQILHNGAPVLDASGLSFDHGVPVDVLSVERIDILRGPASLRYGGGAMGGVVHLQDARIAREPLFDARGGVLGKVDLRAGGAAHERSSAAMVEGGHDRLSWHVDAQERTAGDVRVPTTLSCASGASRRVCNSDLQARGGGAGLTMHSGRADLGLSVSDYRSEYGSVAEERVRIRMQRQQYALQGTWRDPLPGLRRVFMQWGYTHYQHTEYDAGVAGTTFGNQGGHWRLEATPSVWSVAPGLPVEGLVGVQYDGHVFQALGDEAFVPSSRTRNQALYTVQTVKTAWGEWRGGARTEAVTVRSLGGGHFVADERRFQPVHLALGWLHRLPSGASDGRWEWVGNLTRSQRAPKDYELYADGPHVATHTYEVGNAQLGLEQATQLDVGLQWQRGPHAAQFTVFQANFANYIASLPDAQGLTDAEGRPYYRYEGVRARFRGWEATARTRLAGGAHAWLAAASPSGVWDAELRADAVHAVDLTHDQPLPRIAPMRLGADLLWSRAGWGTRVGVDHAWAQNQVPSGQWATGGYTVWHAAATHRQRLGGAQLYSFVRLDNLTNQLAYASTSILRQTLAADNRVPPLPGRSLRVGVQLSF